MLNAKDVKYIRHGYALPTIFKASIVAAVSVFIATAVIFLSQLFGFLKLRGQITVYLSCGICLLILSAFAVWLFILQKSLIKNEGWKNVLKKSEEIVAFDNKVKNIKKTAIKIGNENYIKMPKIYNYVLTIFLLPNIIILFAVSPSIDCLMRLNPFGSRQRAYESVLLVKNALDEFCDRSQFTDPRDKKFPTKYGYTITGFTSGEEFGESCVEVNVNKFGTIESVNYSFSIDRKLSKEENISILRERFSNMQDSFLKMNRKVSEEVYFNKYDLTDEFVERFVNAETYFEDVFVAIKLGNSHSFIISYIPVVEEYGDVGQRPAVYINIC